MLVLCSPLYWYTLSTHLKSAVDKMYAYMRPQCPKDKKLKIREAALLMCAETWFSSSFDGPVATYKSVVGYTGWKDRGMVLAKRVGKKGAIEGSGSLREAEQFGREI